MKRDKNTVTTCETPSARDAMRWRRLFVMPFVCLLYIGDLAVKQTIIVYDKL
jgi:hypothetical protein